MRKKIIAGNWKMHKTRAETESFFLELKKIFPTNSTSTLWVAPPFTALSTSVDFVKKLHLPIAVGAQNMHESSSGAFTGEISAPMLKEAGCVFSIIGHSERRTIFHESSPQIHAKVSTALKTGLCPLLCIGESLLNRESGKYMDTLIEQLTSALDGIPKKELSSIVIAYEPVWAIGTGKTASPEIAERTHVQIREFLSLRFGSSFADLVPILYGGSVSPANVCSIVEKENVDGVLIGGASLDPNTFATIIHQIG